jgi:hypothetical protein
MATEAVSRAPADGYSLLLITAPNAINAALYEKLNFDFKRDIVAVSASLAPPLSSRSVPRCRPGLFRN